MYYPCFMPPPFFYEAQLCSVFNAILAWIVYLLKPGKDLISTDGGVNLLIEVLVIVLFALSCQLHCTSLKISITCAVASQEKILSNVE